MMRDRSRTIITIQCILIVSRIYDLLIGASPLTSTWPHLRCDVGLEEGEYRENCLCLAVLCTVIMVHKDTSSSYRSVNCIGL